MLNNWKIGHRRRDMENRTQPRTTLAVAGIIVSLIIGSTIVLQNSRNAISQANKMDRIAELQIRNNELVKRIIWVFDPPPRIEIRAEDWT